MNLYRCRSASVHDREALASFSRNSVLFEHVLRPRFACADDFFAELLCAHKRSVLFVGCDAAERTLGWACCFEFHRRAGYAGVAQFALDVDESALSPQLGSELYRSCELECRRLGWRSIIAFAHSNMRGSAEWYIEMGFETCGRIELADSRQLGIYRKDIGP